MGFMDCQKEMGGLCAPQRNKIYLLLFIIIKMNHPAKSDIMHHTIERENVFKFPPWPPTTKASAKRLDPSPLVP